MPGFDPRRAKPGTKFTTTGPDGEQLTLRADADGVVHPKNEGQQALLDAFGLPVARKAKAEAVKKEDTPNA